MDFVNQRAKLFLNKGMTTPPTAPSCSGQKILNAELWEMHLSRQFKWGINHRKMIYEKIDIKNQKRVLDAGCGIGLVTREIRDISGGEVYGIDNNSKMIEIAKKKFPDGKFKIGSIEDLPFEDNYFDVTFCIFVLMWVKDPKKALTEMLRVTRPGGFVVCASEPDYGGKIDYPDDFNSAAASIRALQIEGANPFFGRKLKALFSQVSLKAEVGVWANFWDDEIMKQEFEHIWKFAELSARNELARNWLHLLKRRDKEAIEKGERITMLPMFWGIAQKKLEVGD